jgi:hypothetical protein
MGVGNWQVGGSPVPDTVIQRNATEGYSCPGSLEMMVPFTAYGTQSDAQINFSPVQNWVGYRKLHARVKIVMPSTGNLDHINGVQFAVNSDNYMNYDGKFTSASTFMDFGWHDIELDLTLAAAPARLDHPGPGSAADADDGSRNGTRCTRAYDDSRRRRLDRVARRSGS